MKPRTSAEGVTLSYPAVRSVPELVEFGAGSIRYDDPFRWLEEDTDINVIRWQNAEDPFARTHLANLPTYQEFLAKLQSMGASDDVVLPVFAGNQYVRRFIPEGQDLEVVELSDSPTGPGRRVADLNAMRADEPFQMA